MGLEMYEFGYGTLLAFPLNISEYYELAQKNGGSTRI